MNGSNPQINPNYHNDIALIGQEDGLDSMIIATFGYHTSTLPDENYISDHVNRANTLLIEQFQWTMEQPDE